MIRFLDYIVMIAGSEGDIQRVNDEIKINSPKTKILVYARNL